MPLITVRRVIGRSPRNFDETRREIAIHVCISPVACQSLTTALRSRFLAREFRAKITKEIVSRSTALVKTNSRMDDPVPPIFVSKERQRFGEASLESKSRKRLCLATTSRCRLIEHVPVRLIFAREPKRYSISRCLVHSASDLVRVRKSAMRGIAGRRHQQLRFYSRLTYRTVPSLLGA